MTDKKDDDKKPPIWQSHPEIWKSQSAWFAFLRGVLRSGWKNFPVKNKFLKKVRKRIPNPSPRGRHKTIWGGTCEMCKNDFPSKDMQVDHKIGAGSLNDWDDLEDFTRRLFDVTEDDLQYLCKPCHSIKSYSERYNVTMEEARKRKDQIAFDRLTLPQMQRTLRDMEVEDVPSSKVECKAMFKKMMENTDGN